jgi:hypothetical protein
MVRLSKPCTYVARMLTPSSNGPKQDSTWPTSPRCSIRCVQNDFWAYERLVQTVHLSWVKISAISKRIKTSYHLSLGCIENDYWAYGTLGANHAPILCQDYHCLQTDQNELPPEPRHLGVPSGVSKMISDPMVRLSKPCTYLARMLTPSSNGPKQDSTWPTSPWCSIGCVQNYFWAYVRSVQTMHLSCVMIVTITKHTNTTVH